MKISEISNIVNLPENTIRYYDKKHLLKIQRDKNSIRNFKESDIEWIKFLKRLKDTGMILKTIQHYAALRYLGPSTMPERLNILQQHRHDVLAEQLKWNECLLNLDDKIEFYEESIKENLHR